jgi:hypothetical protein
MLDEPVFNAGFFSNRLWKYLFDRHGVSRRIDYYKPAATVFNVTIAATPYLPSLQSQACRAFRVDFTFLRMRNSLCQRNQNVPNTVREPGWVTWVTPQRLPMFCVQDRLPTLVVDACRSACAQSSSRHHNRHNAWPDVLSPGLA